jgi:hypothetical protein
MGHRYSSLHGTEAGRLDEYPEGVRHGSGSAARKAARVRLLSTWGRLAREGHGGAGLRR